MIRAGIRTGRWRNPKNVEEGAWLHTLIQSWTGIPITEPQTEALTYIALVGLWILGWWRLVSWHSPS